MCTLTDPIYQDADKAREHLEALRWPDGPVCPHCGVIDSAHEMTGKSTRPGLWKCRDCRKPFSVTVGTVFERSKIPLNKWLMATQLIASSKKGMSSHQLHRTLGVTYKTAWFMAHRIREAMKPLDPLTFGSGSGVIEADETYIGRKKGAKKAKAGYGHKNAIFALVERKGKVRSVHVRGNLFEGVKKALMDVSLDSHLMTDTASMYNNIGKAFMHHSRVNHYIKEYVRGHVHTNTIEGFFSIFKRGMKGIYQHCSEDHLHRYLAEFDFRYNHRTKLGVSDTERAAAILKGIEGKRLTYRRPAESYQESQV